MSRSLTIHGYTEEQLMAMRPDDLRAILHERTHHTVEVSFYRLLKEGRKPSADYGKIAEYLLELWRKRGLPMDPPDIRWCARYVELAKRISEGEVVEIAEPQPESFTEDEVKVVERLIYGRRSIRQFKPESVPDWMIERILRSGLYAPHGCNVGCTRFLVLKDPEEQRLVSSDIPIENCVMIVVLQEMSMYKTLRFDERVPQNIYYDAAAAADHICIMAHALGLGSCWLTHGEDTQVRLRERFKLSPTMTSRNHIIVGWPGEKTIKSERMGLDEVVLNEYKGT